MSEQRGEDFHRGASQVLFTEVIRAFQEAGVDWQFGDVIRVCRDEEMLRRVLSERGRTGPPGKEEA